MTANTKCAMPGCVLDSLHDGWHESAPLSGEGAARKFVEKWPGDVPSDLPTETEPVQPTDPDKIVMSFAWDVVGLMDDASMAADDRFAVLSIVRTITMARSDRATRAKYPELYGGSSRTDDEAGT